jgi:hypothetical protein
LAQMIQWRISWGSYLVLISKQTRIEATSSVNMAIRECLGHLIMQCAKTSMAASWGWGNSRMVLGWGEGRWRISCFSLEIHHSVSNYSFPTNLSFFSNKGPWESWNFWVLNELAIKQVDLSSTRDEL